jgi:hypothetical protein
MRFVFVSFSQSVFPEVLSVEKKLESIGHKIVYWLGSSEPISFIDEKGRSGVIDDNFLLSLSSRVSLGAEDLKKLSDKEPSTFDFLQRMHPNYGFSELERRYHLLLRYCKWLLKELRTDVVVFRITPNLPPVHFILYNLAQASGIKTVIFCDTWVSSRVVAMNDFVSGVSELKNDLSKNFSFSSYELSGDLLEYYDLHTKDAKQGSPVYMPNILNSYNFFGRFQAAFKSLRQIWRLGLLKKMWRTLIGRSLFWIYSHLVKELPRIYKHLSSSPDFSKFFIYFPLHLQPEFSTNPLGGFFRDQLLALEILVSSLPKGWEIYVKEHPTQWPVGGTRHNPYRPKDYYQQMARFPSVRLIPTDTDSFKLTRHAKAVATISGTAGWEAVLRGKPALIFGYPWYQHAPGVFKVKDVSTCREVMERVRRGYTLHQQEVLQFLKRLDQVSFRGCVDLTYRTNLQYFTQTPESQAEGMFESIKRLL